MGASKVAGSGVITRAGTVTQLVVCVPKGEEGQTGSGTY